MQTKKNSQLNYCTRHGFFSFYCYENPQQMLLKYTVAKCFFASKIIPLNAARTLQWHEHLSSHEFARGNAIEIRQWPRDFYRLDIAHVNWERNSTVDTSVFHAKVSRADKILQQLQKGTCRYFHRKCLLPILAPSLQEFARKTNWILTDCQNDLKVRNILNYSKVEEVDPIVWSSYLKKHQFKRRADGLLISIYFRSIIIRDWTFQNMNLNISAFMWSCLT